MTRKLPQTVRVLTRLTERVRKQQWPEDGPRPRFTPLIDVVGDIGRALSQPDAEELHAVLPHLAALREELEQDYLDGGVEQSPWRALSHDKAEPYAAGALWACSATINAVLSQCEHLERESVARNRRSAVRKAVRDVVHEQEAVTPSDIRQYLLEQSGIQVTASTVSKGIGDLLSAGEIAAVPPPDDADRRHRYYSYCKEPGSDENNQVENLVRRFVTTLLAYTDRDEIEKAVSHEVARQTTRDSAVAGR